MNMCALVLDYRAKTLLKQALAAVKDLSEHCNTMVHDNQLEKLHQDFPLLVWLARLGCCECLPTCILMLFYESLLYMLARKQPYKTPRGFNYAHSCIAHFRLFTRLVINGRKRRDTQLIVDALLLTPGKTYSVTHTIIHTHTHKSLRAIQVLTCLHTARVCLHIEPAIIILPQICVFLQC